MKDIYLKYNMPSLALIGLYPLNIKAHRIIHYLHYIYSLFVITFFATFVLTEYIEISQRLSDNSDDIVNNLSVSLLYTVTLVKVKIARSTPFHNFIRQIRATEQIIMQSHDAPQREIYMKHVRWNHGLNKLFIGLTSVTTVLFYAKPSIIEMVNPILNNTRLEDGTVVYADRELPFSSWLPFDKNRWHYVAFLVQCVAGTFGSWLTCSTDILFWGVMIFAIAQIKILQHKLRSLEDCQLNGENDELNHDGVFLVRKCAVLHQIIIQFIFELNKSLNFLMFMDFGICSMQIGVIGFQVIVSGFGWSQMFALQYLMAMLMQMFLFYWHANEIILESMNVSDAVMESGFYKYSPSIQKSLKLIMMRSQIPLILKVGRFYAMSTATAISIVRGAYSYIALMRQVYG